MIWYILLKFINRYLIYLIYKLYVKILFIKISNICISINILFSGYLMGIIPIIWLKIFFNFFSVISFVGLYIRLGTY